MTSTADVVERLLRLLIKGRVEEAFALLDEGVAIRRRDGTMHHGLPAARLLRAQDAELASTVAQVRLSVMLAKADRAAVGANVTFNATRPRTDNRRAEVAWSFRVRDGSIVAVEEHDDLQSAVQESGIHSAREPGVERRLYSWGMFAASLADLVPRVRSPGRAAGEHPGTAPT